MAKKIKVKKRVRPLYKDYIDRSKLEQVKTGGQLKDLTKCYHINPSSPDVISTINLKGIHRVGKLQVIGWIHQEKIYILNAG